MPLLVYKVKDYEHTAENEQYCNMCNALRSVYAQSNNSCLVVANYNVAGCELDALVITEKAVIIVEFKNIGGNYLSACENGEWTIDGQIVKGGVSKNPFEQARTNRSKVRDRLNSIFGPKTLSAVLIAFNQDVCSIDDSGLSHNTKCWLKITDMRTFGQKIRCISTHINLSSEGVLKLAERLELKTDWLDVIYSSSIDDTVDSIAACKVTAKGILDSVNAGYLPIVVSSYQSSNHNEEYIRELKVTVKGVSQGIYSLLPQMLVEKGIKPDECVYDESKQLLSWFVGKRILQPYNIIVLLSVPTALNNDTSLRTYLLCKLARTNDCQETVQYLRIGPTLLSYPELRKMEIVQTFVDNDFEIFCLEGYEIDEVNVISSEELVDRIGSKVVIEGVDDLLLCTQQGVSVFNKRNLFKPVISQFIRPINKRLDMANYCCLYNADDQLTTWGRLYEQKYQDLLYQIFNNTGCKIDNFVYPYLTLQKIVPESERLVGADPYGTMGGIYDTIIQIMKEVISSNDLLSNCKFAGHNNIIKTVLEL